MSSACNGVSVGDDRDRTLDSNWRSELMTPEIHGALVGGAVGGLVAVTAAWATVRFDHRALRQERRQDMLLGLADAMNRARLHLRPEGSLATKNPSAETGPELQEVHDRLLSIFHGSRRWERRGRRIQSEAMREIARWTAAAEAARSRHPFEWPQLLKLGPERLRSAIWPAGDEADIEGLVALFREKGLDSDQSSA